MNSNPQMFQTKIIQAKLSHITRSTIPDFDKKYNEICLWQKAAKDLATIKETAVQGTFMTRIFRDVLGYNEIVDEGDTYFQEREKTTQLDSTESDAALGYFRKSTGTKDIRVVVELKDAKTDLDKKQNRNNHLTPVEQAFSYAYKNSSRCGWVIVSNYIELRLYKSNSMLEYERFDLTKMNDEREFLRFYFFLCRDNLIAEHGKSVIDELYTENETAEMDISNKFYEDYKQIRDKLFSSLKEHNPEKDDLLLFSKTQKLMDRFIFICFCEDCNLLPSCIFQKLIETAKNSFAFSSTRLWDQLKGLFASIDKGNSPMKINQYNGGLFKQDDDLNALVIPDDVLESFTCLSAYDFNSDLNVNILGQIFEQSISDVEQIKAEIQGIVIEESKQKKDGIFYTPYYVTRYIVDQTVGMFLSEKKENLKKELFKDGPIIVEAIRPSTGRKNSREYSTWIEIPAEKDEMSEDEKLEIEFAKELHKRYWLAYEEVLKNIKICDPACGSGAFLNQCFDYLKEEMDYVLDMRFQFDRQRSLFDIDKSILQNNLFGVDINAESVEITKLSLWLKTAKSNQTLASLDNNIKCGNSIINDADVVDNAFIWEKEFPDVFENGGFDIIVGNPPYGAKLQNNEKEYITKSYVTSEGKFDTYHTFFELGMNILKQDGFLGYITPNTYLILEKGTVKLRRFLFDNFTAINFVELFNVFPNAVVEPIISIYRKCSTDIEFSVISVPRKTTLSSTFINEGIVTVFDQSDLRKDEDYKFNYRETDYDKVLKNKIKHDSIMVNDRFKVTQGAIPYGKGEGNPPQTKQTIDEKPFTKFTKEDDSWVPYYKGKNINRYIDAWGGEFIKWGEWLCRPRTVDVWNGPKLFIRQTGDYPIATYIEGFKVAKNSIHSITPLPGNVDVELKYLLALLNSKMMKWVFRNDNFHIVNKPLAETKAIYIKRLPIKIGHQKEIICLVDQLLSINERKVGKANLFLKYLKEMYRLNDLSESIQEFYLHDFKTLISELKKLKVKLLPKEQIGLMELFDDYKSLVIEDSKEVQTIEDRIDEYVYSVFELNNEEIEYIEEALRF